MTHRVTFDPDALDDLRSIFSWIAEQGSPLNARNFANRIVEHCLSFETFPERGTRRDDLRPGLRTIGFQGNVAIAFVVTRDEVKIARILYGGRDLASL